MRCSRRVVVVVVVRSGRLAAPPRPPRPAPPALRLRARRGRWHRTRRRILRAIEYGQSFELPREPHGNPVLSRGQADGKFLGPSLELAVNRDDASLHAVDEYRHLQRFGAGRPRAVVRRRADHVVAGDAEAVHHVKAVRHRQPGLVVVRHRQIGPRIEEKTVEIPGAPPAVRLIARSHGLDRLRPVHRRARDHFRGGRYFSICVIESDSTSPLLSKP